MRPILWGIILFIVGAVGWVISVVFAVVTLGTLKLLTFVFGALFIFSLPVAVVLELTKWLKRKKRS